MPLKVQEQTMAEDLTGAKADLVSAVDLVIAAFDDDPDRGNRIFNTADTAELVMGLVGLAKLIGLAAHGHDAAAVRADLIQLRQAMEIDQTFGEL
jgi:hypothetical protein